jgi:hypothetical protein
MGIALVAVICIGLVIFISALLPKRIKTCPVETLRKATKIIIPGHDKDTVVPRDSKEFNDIVSNFSDEGKSPEPDVSSITIHLYVGIVKYVLQISLSGWNFLGENKNSRKLFNYMGSTAAINAIVRGNPG